MRLLLITPLYAPDLGPSAPLFTMLSSELVRRGHQVTVLAAVPHYPSGKVPAEYRGWRIRRSVENGVDVVRVPVPSADRSKLALRLLQFVCYQLGATWAGLGARYDVVLTSNPALWVLLPFAVLAVLRRKPVIFSIHDLYPDVGIALGVFRNRPVVAAVTAIERFCLHRAAIVRILSESFRPGLHALGVPGDKMAMVYDWVDTDLIQPLPRDNNFAQEFGLSDRFVVLYAGNIGRSQGLEHVLAAAQILHDDPNVLFVFVGDGAGREALLKQAEQLRLSNVRILPFQPRSRLPEVLASADLSLVILRHGIGRDSLPSKTFSILASGRPVLVSVDENSEISKLVQRAQAGVCVPAEDPACLAAMIQTLQRDQDLRERFGRSGRLWVERHHSPASAARQFEALLAAAIVSRNGGVPKLA